MLDTITQFRDAIRAAGLTPPETIHADGVLRRFATNGKRHDAAGWYVLRSDRMAHGAFGDWRIGLAKSWSPAPGRPLTAFEANTYRATLGAMKRKWQAEQKRRQDAAAIKAASIWASALMAPDDYPYLVKKQVRPFGVRIVRGKLVVPMYSDGTLHSLQFIGPTGDKKFLPGGRVNGCYFVIGDTGDAAHLMICEGFATAATLHATTRAPVAAAFTAGNLEPVAKALRVQFPRVHIIVCADDDIDTFGNPGVTKATAASRAIGASLAFPYFGEKRPNWATDFNDMAAVLGGDAVGQRIASSASTAPTDHDYVRHRPPGPRADVPVESAPCTDRSAGTLSDRVLALETIRVSDATAVQPPNHRALPVTSTCEMDVQGVTRAAQKEMAYA